MFALMSASIGDPGVDSKMNEVDKEVYKDGEGSGEQDEALDGSEVRIPDRLDRVLSDATPREHVLGQQTVHRIEARDRLWRDRRDPEPAQWCGSDAEAVEEHIDREQPHPEVRKCAGEPCVPGDPPSDYASVASAGRHGANASANHDRDEERVSDQFEG